MALLNHRILRRKKRKAETTHLTPNLSVCCNLSLRKTRPPKHKPARDRCMIDLPDSCEQPIFKPTTQKTRSHTKILTESLRMTDKNAAPRTPIARTNYEIHVEQLPRRDRRDPGRNLDCTQVIINSPDLRLRCAQYKLLASYPKLLH